MLRCSLWYSKTFQDLQGLLSDACFTCVNIHFGPFPKWLSFHVRCEYLWCLSLPSLVWCTQKRNGRKSGTSCWSWPPASPGSITAPTAPSGTAHTPSHTPSVHAPVKQPEAVLLLLAFSLWPFTLNRVFNLCCCRQGGVVRRTCVRELRGVPRLRLGPRPETAGGGGGWHHAEGLRRRRWVSEPPTRSWLLS